MALPMTAPNDFPPIPPELEADDAPLSVDVLERLDAAFGAAENDGTTEAGWTALFAGADPLENPDAPAAAHLLPDEVRRPWLVDDGAAEWAMRHVAQIDVELRALAERRDQWAAKIDRWFDQASGTLLRRRSFMVAHLIGYGAARRAADPKAPKTLSLPSGKITSRDTKPAVRVVDDEALAAWLTERELLTGPDDDPLVKITTKVYVAPLRKILQPAGAGLVIVPTGEPLKPDEFPPGLDVEQGHTTYDVKPA